VSAPTENQMMQSLERLGFITRQRGTPRSIHIVGPADCAACGGSHHLKNPNLRGLTVMRTPLSRKQKSTRR
jgi:hypothetical protein